MLVWEKVDVWCGEWGHEYVGVTCGSGMVYSAADVIRLSVVCGVRVSWWNVCVFGSGCCMR